MVSSLDSTPATACCRKDPHRVDDFAGGGGEVIFSVMLEHPRPLALFHYDHIFFLELRKRTLSMPTSVLDLCNVEYSLGTSRVKHDCCKV